MNARLASWLAKPASPAFERRRRDQLARKGLTTRRAYDAAQNRAERVVLAICFAMIIGAAALGLLSNGGAT